MLETICGHLWPLNAGLPSTRAGVLGQWQSSPTTSCTFHLASWHHSCMDFLLLENFHYISVIFFYLNICSDRKKKTNTFYRWSKKWLLKFGKILISRLVLFRPCLRYLRSPSEFHCKVLCVLDRPVNVIWFVEKWIHLEICSKPFRI